MTGTELTALDEMRQLARKPAALARAAESLLDDVVPVDDASRARLEDLAHLVGATAEAANATVDAGVKLDMDARALHRQGVLWRA
jgi:hypothetical protein